jgi:hypothetical protein
LLFIYILIKAPIRHTNQRLQPAVGWVISSKACRTASVLSEAQQPDKKNLSCSNASLLDGTGGRGVPAPFRPRGAHDRENNVSGPQHETIKHCSNSNISDPTSRNKNISSKNSKNAGDVFAVKLDGRIPVAEAAVVGATSIRSLSQTCIGGKRMIACLQWPPPHWSVSLECGVEEVFIIWSAHR